MTSKHTPGRWKVAPQTFSIKAEQVGTVVYGNPDNPNREADARLISAAPDLLAALRQLYAATPDNEGGALGKACVVSRHAIAKAEGR